MGWVAGREELPRGGSAGVLLQTTDGGWTWKRKLWGALPLTFLFAAANIPMLLRHGLMKEDAVPAEPGPIE